MHVTLPYANVGPEIADGKFECCQHLPVWNYTHQMLIYIQVYYKNIVSILFLDKTHIIDIVRVDLWVGAITIGTNH